VSARPFCRRIAAALIIASAAFVIDALGVIAASVDIGL
jgi:hypothetical protein